MLLASFAWSFVFVSLPFHIQAMSTLPPAATLRWTGLILGVTSLVTVGTSPIWGRLGTRGNPKAYYLWVEIGQGVGFLLMAAARSLPELFVSRVLLGFMGASSTLAFMLAGRTADAGEVRRRIAAIQSGMTVGQMLGPLAGAVVAAGVGFRPSFVIGGLILFACAGVVRWGVNLPPDPPGSEGHGRPPARVRDLVVACTIILAGSSQVFFLTAVLPEILPRLGVGAARVVETGGLVLFISAAGAAAGALLTSRLARLAEESRLVALLLVVSSVCLALQGAMPGIVGFMVFRFLQVLCVAPVFPLVVARIAQQAGGAAIGIVNSSRIGAAFLGPVLATSILAWTSPPALFAVLALLGLASVPLVLWRWPAAPAHAA